MYNVDINFYGELSDRQLAFVIGMYIPLNSNII